MSINLPSGTEDVEIIGSIFNNPAFEPEVTEPEVTEPEVTEPEVTEPEVIEKTPKTQCGPGTILSDGVCVLDQRCGPGTVLIDDVCVLVSTPQPSETSVKGVGSELVIGTITAFGVTAAIGIILALISKVSKSRD